MKIIIVDDEKPMLYIMVKMISKIPDIEIVGTFQNTREAYRFLKANSVDMAFVDIKMPEESGLDFARTILSEFPDMDIVFLTSYKEYALEAFDVYAFDYIVKPVSQERLEHTVKRAAQRRIPVHANKKDRASGKLSVYCLGELDIRSVDGDTVQLNSSKSAEVLAYLLLNQGRYVSKWRIMEDVFRGMTPQNAEAYLNTTIYKLRKALEPYNKKAAVISANESYSIDVKGMYLDFVDFENRVNTLALINESNLELALKTEKLYRGELFGDKEYYWSLPEKERYMDLYWNFTKKLGSYMLEKNNLAAAQQIFKKLIVKNELDEEVNCFLMKVYAAGKDRVSLIRHYERYKKVIQKELGIVPGHVAADLYAALKKSLE